jgi:hypothetical protein
MSSADLINIGLSDTGDDKLDYLREQGYFAEKMDAYRFAVSLALASGVVPPEIAKRKTFLNVGSFDPDQAFRRAIETLMPDMLEETTVYRLVERLADWGVSELYAEAQAGNIDFQKIFDQVAAKKTA